MPFDEKAFLKAIKDGNSEKANAMLKENQVTSLKLGWNGLHHFTEKQWEALGSALSKSLVTSLDLRRNKLHHFTEKQWEALGSALSKSLVTSLGLSWNNLQQFTEKQWEALGRALSKSLVTSLNLSSNYLTFFTEKQWEALGRALSKSLVTSLDLSENALYQLTEKHWDVLSRVFSKTKINAVIDLSKNGFDNIAGMKILMRRLTVADAMHLRIKLDEINDPQILGNWAAERLEKDILPIVSLDLSKRRLSDDFIQDTLSYLLNHNFIYLEELNLSHNQLTLDSLMHLLKLFSTQGLKNIKKLDLNHNYIELTSNDQLERINAELMKISHLTELNLTGNMIISSPTNAALLELLHGIILRSQLTIKQFLKSEFVSLKKVKNTETLTYELTLKTKTEDLQCTVSLSHMELTAFNTIKDKKMMTEVGLVDYFTSKLNDHRLEMGADLLDHPLNHYSEEEQKNQIKRLMDYHPDSPLSGKLKTHSIIRSDNIEYARSILFSDNKLYPLTASQGMVYLVANKKSRHTRLIYEWLTEYGQRFMAVADLTIGEKNSTGFSMFSTNSKQIIIDFEFENPLKTKKKYLKSEYYAIAGLAVQKDRLESMHEKIQDEKDRGVASRYKWFISNSSFSQEENKEVGERRVQNCCKWATDHIEVNLGIKLNITIYNPLTIIATLRKNSASIVSHEDLIEDKKADASNKNEKCFMM